MYGRFRPFEWALASFLLLWGASIGIWPTSLDQSMFATLKETWSMPNLLSLVLVMVSMFWFAALARNGHSPAPYLRAAAGVIGAALWAEIASSVILAAGMLGYVSPSGLVYAGFAATCIFCAYQAVRDVRFVH